jgi:hypothetical protein
VIIPQIGLNFNLSAQLVLDASLEQLGLLDHLDSHNKLGLAFSCQVNVSKFSSA